MKGKKHFSWIFLVLLSFAFMSGGGSSAESGEGVLTFQTESGEKSFVSSNGVITIPPGEYRILSDYPEVHVFAEGLTGVTINSEGAHFVFTDPKADGIRFSRCSGVTLNGLTMSYSEPFYTQGVVTRVRNNSVEFRVDTGYPDLKNLPGTRYMGIIWDQNLGRQKKGTSHLFDETRTANSNRLTNVYTANVSRGDKIVVRNLDIRARVVISDSSEKMVFRNVTVTSGGVAFMEDTGNGGNRYEYCKVQRAGPERILSTAADALHSKCMKSGPIIENCLFENMGDDGVNIHGLYSEVLTVNGNKIVVSALHEGWRKPFVNGDTIEAYSRDSKTFTTLGTVTDVSEPIPENPTGVKPSSEYFSRDRDSTGFFEVTLTLTAGVKRGDLLYSPDRVGSGFVIKNTRVLNNCSRGFLIKAQNGRIENCEIDGSSIYGLLFDAELGANWVEALFPREIEVTGTVIKNSGHMGNGYPSVYISPQAHNISISQ